MKLVITGSLGNISKPLTQLLVEKGHDLTVISKDAEKVRQIEAFDAKAIYTMVSPNWTVSNYRQ